MSENRRRFSKQEIVIAFKKGAGNQPILGNRIEHWLHLKSIKICNCKICNTTNEYAQPNQSDGTYLCYDCR